MQTGQIVTIRAFGRLYLGQVVRATATRVLVRFQPPTGHEHARWFKADRVKSRAVVMADMMRHSFYEPGSAEENERMSR